MYIDHSYGYWVYTVNPTNKTLTEDNLRYLLGKTGEYSTFDPRLVFKSSRL